MKGDRQYGAPVVTAADVASPIAALGAPRGASDPAVASASAAGSLADASSLRRRARAKVADAEAAFRRPSRPYEPPRRVAGRLAYTAEVPPPPLAALAHRVCDGRRVVDPSTAPVFKTPLIP